ncbi:hypothetical protein GW17_00022724 [Ensete ventricosum]|nr:hypothetical protein GW17_00022724 [Ensete ventricosum]
MIVGSEIYGRPLYRRSKPVGAPSGASARRTSPSAVPFSWEQLPGIPKAQIALDARSPDPSLLPLPPTLGSVTAGPRKKRPVAGPRPASDPFAAALAVCAKPPRGSTIGDLLAASGSAAGRHRRGSAASAWSISDRLGLLGLYASCKTTCAVADSSVYVPRSASYRPLTRRSA